jgi:hypothetical protein
MQMKSFAMKVNKILVSALFFLFCSVLLNLGLWQYALCGPAYQISGFYLGATPDELGITIEIDPLVEEKYYEVETNGVRLFFIRNQRTLRLYRIIQEQAMDPNKVTEVLDSLKAKYGTPDKQQIKTSGVRPKNKSKYITTVKNKAIWSISETQDFSAEIESKRVLYELLDHNPENIKPPGKIEASEASEGGGLSTESWNPDY